MNLSRWAQVQLFLEDGIDDIADVDPNDSECQLVQLTISHSLLEKIIRGAYTKSCVITPSIVRKQFERCREAASASL